MGDISMPHQIFSATGCARCNITKRFMKENGIVYQEYDIKADGKDAFARFYRAHRADIYRDKDGVEFPVFTDGNVIRQGVSVVIGHLIAGNRLDGFIGRSALHGEWLDGINISGGDPSQAEDLMAALNYLKQSGLKIQLTTNGKNAAVLRQVFEKGLGDRVIMAVKGPASLYPRILGEEIGAAELQQSISFVAKFPDYEFYTTVSPVKRSDDSFTYLTPEEIGEAAQMIESASGSKKHPYTLRLFDPKSAEDDRLKVVEALPAGAMFKYRTAARRYQVMAEIAK
jgi:pyruvate-formate lyase-activating enzyme/glutaredoxin